MAMSKVSPGWSAGPLEGRVTTTAGPVCRPARTASRWAAATGSAAKRSWRSRAARTARSASSSCARGYPKQSQSIRLRTAPREPESSRQTSRPSSSKAAVAAERTSTSSPPASPAGRPVWTSAQQTIVTVLRSPPLCRCSSPAAGRPAGRATGSARVVPAKVAEAKSGPAGAWKGAGPAPSKAASTSAADRGRSRGAFWSSQSTRSQSSAGIAGWDSWSGRTS